MRLFILMHKTLSQVTVKGPDVVTSIATIGTFEATRFFRMKLCKTHAASTTIVMLSGFPWSLLVNIRNFSKISQDNVKFGFNLTTVVGTLREGHCTYVITSRSILLRMRNASGKFVGEIKTQVLCLITFFPITCLLCCNVENAVEPDRPQICACALHAGYIRLQKHTQNKYRIFSIDNAHLMYNAHPKLFRHSFWCIDNAHDVFFYR